MEESITQQRKKLPDRPGVYLFKDGEGEVLYIGKALNLKKRVANYFSGRLPSAKIAVMVPQIKAIDYVETGTETDALLFEASLISEYAPRYNTRLKDDKTYPLLKITKEEYPRLHITRKKTKGGTYFGPYTDAKLLREAVRMIQSIYPIRKCRTLPKKACLYYYINQCIGPCIKKDKAIKKEHDDLIAEVSTFLGAGKRDLISFLTNRMKEEAKKLNFEQAQVIKEQIAALGNLNKKRFRLGSGTNIKFAATNELKAVLGLKGKMERIVCFDVSNLMGQWAVASKVSFFKEMPDKNNYRRFKIKTVDQIDDYSMMREAVRRFIRGVKEKKDLKPNLIVIDGGKGHLRAAHEVLVEEKCDKIPIISIAKRYETLHQVVGDPILLPEDSSTLNLIKKIRDEAHRFAVQYHTRLRGKEMKKSFLDDIRGVGPKTKQRVLTRFAAAAELAKASSLEIAERCEISLVLAERIKKSVAKK